MSGDGLINNIPERERKVVRLFQRTPRAKIGLLVKELGLEIQLVELPPNEAGSLEYDYLGGSETGYIIKVNKNHPPALQRFTVAHELAHYFLHKKDVDQDPFFEPQKRNVGENVHHFYMENEIVEEREANRFAAAILMDRYLTEAFVKKHGPDPRRAAEHFWVPERVAEIRIRTLGLSLA